MKYYILFNPLAGNKKCSQAINNLKLPENAEVVYCNMTEIQDYNVFLSAIKSEDKIVICGGDGTINRFVNSADVDNIENEILYFAAGSGNDFIHDLDLQAENDLLPINKYIKNLPTVYVKDKLYKFLNGIGFGIDGYCCEEGDRIRKKRNTGKPINYTPIALKGLLFAFKPTNATVKVDGKTYTYKKVWLAPTMNGRFFGGGMMIAPDQNRINPDNAVTLLVGHDLSKLRILSLFPLIFKGKHIKYTKFVAVHKGHDISVEFDRPTALQIDGETFSQVLCYDVTTRALATQNK